MNREVCMTGTLQSRFINNRRKIHCYITCWYFITL